MSAEDAEEAEKARQAKVAEMAGKLPLDTDGRFKVGTVLRKKLDLEEIERDENADANSCEPTHAQGLGLVPQTAKTQNGTPTDDKTELEKWIEGKIADVDKDDADNPLPYSVEFADGTFEDLSHEELEVWVEAQLKHKKTEERRVWDEEQERKRSEREAKFADKTQKAAEKAAEKEAKQLAKVREARDKAAAEAAAAEPTEYARSRPRRETVAVGATTFRDAGGGTLDLHPMRKFSPSPPGLRCARGSAFQADRLPRGDARHGPARAPVHQRGHRIPRRFMGPTHQVTYHRSRLPRPRRGEWHGRGDGPDRGG